ncbi:hypothetical protein AMAG_10482 [Allomyces macrogynus ATCC 38327]|uniref:Mitochondrial DNA polymerase catalytic subunit n=1 Tax=Allomyces macrogynus (strain ATCC 38327) TaxID=578462 RepID=A0A0L0SV29_ALLM3|nr:hypothetical protein AMAG_10482 [Allomyces macrogynus ATCC 38327]|eukprot:KNE66245.1 hypothetical protein AMAG_10482 [Allomyces macrogynus ATCC 38327]
MISRLFSALVPASSRCTRTLSRTCVHELRTRGRPAAPSAAWITASRRTLATVQETTTTKPDDQLARKNPLEIQMLSPALHRQLFPGTTRATDPRHVRISHDHLESWGLDISKSTLLPEVDMMLPPLLGPTIEDHFRMLGDKFAQPALGILETYLARTDPDPPMPEQWVLHAGWTRYDADGTAMAVPYPDEDLLVFDIEVVVKLGHHPCLATARSATAWYAWVSPWVLDNNAAMPIPETLIPMGPSAKCIIGHNVGYDRTAIAEEYRLEGTQNVFIDTLSLHVAANGMSTQQRPTYEKVTRGNADRIPRWVPHTTTNSLAATAKYYLGRDLPKDVRDTFMTAESPVEIQESFQELMNYCATDVVATADVFRAVFPQFRKKCPHPISFLGMAKMGSCFLPVTTKWRQFISDCETMAADMAKEIDSALLALAHDAITRYIDTSQARTWNGLPPEGPYPLSSYLPETLSLNMEALIQNPWLRQLNWEMKPLRVTKKGVPAKNQKLANYPDWFRDLWDPPSKQVVISQRKRVAPLLLELKWAGHPLVFSETHKWCYMVAADKQAEHEQISAHVEFSPETNDYLQFEPWITKGYQFFKLPHKDGDAGNTGNPFSKSFAPFFENATITSDRGEAKRALQLQMQCSYWISAAERITSQFVVWGRDVDLGARMPRDAQSEWGIILPKLQAMGTITRRAVESTWLTASNAKKTRLGSDIKRYVEAPPGWALVGADVDSEELWISSAMGDAQFGLHGASALGWMTLQGTKADATDLHSVTANILGITRDQAKQFNYARIYGAGVAFATGLLTQHNRMLPTEVATQKAETLYEKTKGLKRRMKIDGVTPPFEYWVGGRESYMFNSIEAIAHSADPRTPVLGCQIPNSLMKVNCGSEFMTSRINWVVQSSGVDYLHLLIASMEYLIEKYQLQARLMLTIHDEIRYLVRDEDKYRAAMALQISNLWTRVMFASRLGFDDLPLSCAFFSAVDVDQYLRKEPTDPCITPTNSIPLPPGESLDLYKLLAKQNVLLEPATAPQTSVPTASPSPSTPSPTTGLRTEHMASWLLLQSKPDLTSFKAGLNEFVGHDEAELVRKALGSKRGGSSSGKRTSSSSSQAKSAKSTPFSEESKAATPASSRSPRAPKRDPFSKLAKEEFNPYFTVF